MIRKSKLLIFTLFMSLMMTVLPGMESYAADSDGGETYAAGLQDENSQRLEAVTAMDENGNVYEIADTDGTVVTEESEEGIAAISARDAGAKVVNLNTKGNAVTEYTSDIGNGYTNGAYGADAAYLGTTANGQVRFMLAGVTGTVNASEVQVLNYDSVSANVSYYAVSGGKLLHYISQNLNQAPTSALNNGPAPSYLSEGTKYYSYDGHYFYTDYVVMSSDYQNGCNGQNAVNAGNPFYNYFQFLNMTGSTSYSGDELNNILNTAMANAWIDPAVSKLTGTGHSFVTHQNAYSVHALLSLGIAINESGWGTSWICQNKNNIFGLNAVDTAPGQSADVYASIDECIRVFMKDWMAGGYFDSTDWRNHGTLLGNKAEGINVSYASDPYWGEKAATHAWNLDTIGGSRDYLGIPGGDVTIPDEPSDNNGTPTPDEPSDNNGTSTPDEPSDNNGTPTPDEPSDNNGTPTPDVPSDNNGTPTPDEPSDNNGTPTPDEPSDNNGTPTPDVPSDEPTGNNSAPAPETPDVPSDEQTGNNSTPAPETPDVPSDEPTGNNSTPAPETPDVPSDKPTGNNSTPAPETPDVPSDEQAGNNSAPAPEAPETPEVKPVDTVKEVTSQDKKVTVKGQLSEDASLNVDEIVPNTERYTKYVAAEEVKGKTVLGVYDIGLTGMEGESVELTFYVGTEYNGKSVIILHYTDDVNYEMYKGKVENGQVTINVKGFSPYVIALDEGSAAVKSPKTGDSSNIAMWMILLGASVITVIVVALRRKTYR